MKFVFVLIFLLLSNLLCLALSAEEKNQYALAPSSDRMKLEADRKLIRTYQGQMDILSRVKFFMVNGEVRRAKRELLKVDAQSSLSVLIKKRYQAMLYFIEGEYEQSLEVLEDPLFKNDNAFAKICVLKTFNQVILNKMDDINRSFAHCRDLNSDFSINNEMWLENMIKLKQKDPKLLNGSETKSIIGYAHHIPSLKLWLKLAIYLNQEKLMLSMIADIPQEAFEDNEIRELIGLIYYRTKNYKKSVNFIEDLTTPNAENIKGNIYLSKKYYELAYGQFKLALNKKQNSINAIERAVALAWILGQWQDGFDLSQKVNIKETNEPQRLTLQAAFLTNMKQYDQAKRRLERAQGFFGSKPPKELSQLYGYVSLLTEDHETLGKYLNSACEAWDGLSCWLSLQNNLWSNFSRTIQREDAIVLDQELTLAGLKEKADSVPLAEPKIVDQRDVEEMDDALISVVPATK